MKKSQILKEAARILRENAHSLRDSHMNPRTEQVEPKDVAEDVHYELFLANKLDQYSQVNEGEE